MKPNFLSLCAFAISASASSALTEERPVLVNNPEMCALIEQDKNALEIGMTLNKHGMYSIGFHCEFSSPFDLYWHEERTETLVGFCAENDNIQPTVFAVQLSDFEPGVVRVWTQGRDQALEFTRCWGL